jgi:RNA polymerase sigma factor for flagellar operon FliA
MSSVKTILPRGIRSKSRFAVEHAEASGVPSKFDDLSVKELWERYRKCKDQDLRNFLMEKYLPLVRYNAERIATRLPDEVDIQDLMSAGLFGLKDAIDAFDLERGVKFETYCAPRIRGAILDELRSMDWVPRLVRHRTGRVEGARQKFIMELGREPTEEELASKLALEGEEFDKFRRDSSAVSTFSLTRRCFTSDGSKDIREIDVIKDESQRNPFNDIQRKDIKDLISKGLSRAERLIIILYYYEEMTMKEIGATLNLSESRVSQMHSSILARLKSQLLHRTKDLENAE